ncbi:MAG: hypothetical protein IK117_07930 [Bacteroidales bacterium]|nr:hypothetical protein [Bacteroidales bacterium]
MKTKFILCAAMATLIVVSCGSSENQSGSSSSEELVDVTEQQKPKLMVVPSDQLLNQFNMLKQENAQGKTLLIRDYNGYLLADANSKFIISSIQDAFIKFGFPLNDFEQTLKSINDQDMIDEVDGIKKDAKTMLLTTAKPDVILELDYNLRENMESRGVDKMLTYSIRAIDAFSNKVVAAIQEADYGKNTPVNSAEKLMADALDVQGANFTKQIGNYFNDIIDNGRTITVRVTIENDANLAMSDECLDSDTYTDFLIDYVKKNAYKGAYTLTRNTETELYFTNVQIPTLNEDGTQFSAYDFARAMSKALNKGCGMKSKNRTQGLGDALISIKGM